MKEFPDILEITITEEDRQVADNYWCNTCLIGTAATRMGYKVACVGAIYLTLQDKEDVNITYHGQILSSDVMHDNAYIKPHYNKGVVGKTFLLDKVHEK